MVFLLIFGDYRYGTEPRHGVKVALERRPKGWRFLLFLPEQAPSRDDSVKAFQPRPMAGALSFRPP